jgi:hypothetical protein
MEIFHREKKGVTLIIISYDVVVVRYNEPFSKMLFHSRFLIYVNVLDDESFCKFGIPFSRRISTTFPLSLSLYTLFFLGCVCVCCQEGYRWWINTCTLHSGNDILCRYLRWKTQ